MKNFWRWVIGLVTLGLVVYLLTKVDFAEVWRLVVQSDHWYFLLAFVLYGLSIVILTWRFKYFLDPVTKSSFFFLLKNSVMGFFIGTITPATQMGGDPVRAHYIGKEYGIKRSTIFGVVMADRFYHALVSFFFVLLSAFFAFTFLPLSHDLKLLFQGIFFLIIFLTAAFFVGRFLHKKYDLSKWFGKLMPFLRKKKVRRKKPKKWKKIFLEHFGNFSEIFKKELFDRKLATVGITFSLVYWILDILVSYVLFFAFGTHVSFFLVMLVFNAGILIGEFSPTPGGVGLIEGGMFFLYSIAGISTALALAVALLSRIIFYFYSLVLGGWSLVNLEKNVGP